MTGNQLKTEIKKLNLTQEKAAEMLGVTRATFNNWCKQAELPSPTVKNVKAVFGFAVDVGGEEGLLDLIKSQQRTIENLSETIRSMACK